MLGRLACGFVIDWCMFVFGLCFGIRHCSTVVNASAAGQGAEQAAAAACQVASDRLMAVYEQGQEDLAAQSPQAGREERPAPDSQGQTSRLGQRCVRQTLPSF